MKRWLLVAAAVGLAGCGSVSTKAASTTVGTAAPPAAASTIPIAPPSTPSPTTAQLAHIGTAIAVKDADGNPALVTLVAVMDPATGADQFTVPKAGSRFVGVEFRIDNTGTSALSNDANNDASAIGSNDQTYSADFDSIAGCTNFNDGDYSLPPGQVSTGCVTFQLPLGIKTSKVQFSPSGGFGGVTGQWNAT